MLTLNNPFWSKDQNDLLKVSIRNVFFPKRIWPKFGHGPLYYLTPVVEFCDRFLKLGFPISGKCPTTKKRKHFIGRN